MASENKEERTFYRVRRFAHLADISVSQTYKLIAEGKIAVTRFGTSIRIPASVLRDLERSAKPEVE